MKYHLLFSLCLITTNAYSQSAAPQLQRNKNAVQGLFDDKKTPSSQAPLPQKIQSFTGNPNAGTASRSTRSKSSLMIDPKQQQVANQIDMSTEVDRVQMTTKEALKFTFTMTVAKELVDHIAFPEIGEMLTKSGFRVVEQGPRETHERDDRMQRSQTYTLRADIEGSYIIPPVQMRIAVGDGNRTIDKQTTQLFIEVKSFLSDANAPTDIRAIKDIKRVPFPTRWVVGAIAAIVAVLLIFIGLWWWFRRRKKADEIVILIPLYKRAVELLDDYRTRQLKSVEDIRDYYFLLSELFKSYLEERFGIAATDHTAEEIVVDARALPIDDPQLRDQVGKFFMAADQIKFAKMPANLDDIHASTQLIATFIDETSPDDEKEDM